MFYNVHKILTYIFYEQTTIHTKVHGLILLYLEVSSVKTSLMPSVLELGLPGPTPFAGSQATERKKEMHYLETWGSHTYSEYLLRICGA